MRHFNQALFLVSLLFVSSTLFASCQFYPFLSKGFNFQKFNQCRQWITQCPKQGPIVDGTCVNKVLEKNVGCGQLKKLAGVLNADPAAINAEKIDQLTLIDQTFVADGKQKFFILTPKGCLIKTEINPFELDSALSKQYKGSELFFSTIEKPTFTKKDLRAIVPIKVSKNCAACEVIGVAKVAFDFKANGQFIRKTLVEFSPQQTTE